MKKLLLLIGFIFGISSSQAFDLHKVSLPNFLNSAVENTIASCSSSCYSTFNTCSSDGLPPSICNNNLSSCLSNCSSGGSTPPGGGPPIYDCTGLPKWSSFYCDPY